jgi:type I restriction enzyme S subunit
MSWEKSRLGLLVNVKTGKLDANSSSYDGIYPFFTCSKEPLRINSYSYDCECVLVAGNGDLNVKYFNGKFDAYQRTYIIECLDKSKVNTKYLFYFLDTYLEKLREQAIGGVIKYIKLENLTNVQIPLPPLATQKRIADILDAADALRRKDQELLKKYDELAQAIFIEMFGDPVKNEKGWEVKKLGILCSKITDGEHINPRIVQIGKPLIMAKDIRFDGIDFSDYKCVDELDFIKFTKKCNPEKGDLILVSRGATIGRCCIVETDREFCLMGSTILIKCDTDLTAEFLFQLFKDNNFKKNLVNVSSSSAQQAIYISHVKELQIPLPPIELQKNYLKITKEIKDQFVITSKSHQQLELLFDSLIQKAFKGELVA